ncbi:6-phosphogluconate dehydrogenase NAD-binding protein [Thioalkalivibrio sp. K90mix]|uniref:NAD(P)-dependent oxidoreductase n=1 Tax=unclassified Thioalkalivibrio TaxID=2621013 RepID=UPI000195A4A7|nr:MULTISPECIES: NAD(P)-dependent oxidoreductase [unclassified Thioalkalivibrio]ADC70691.1 6-phosphogluconate dehydrogenase NAD-binding protein [Thioalkalivibrio sp. K90mix]
MAASRVALLGCGLMGQPMGLRLLRAGFSVEAYNRTQERASDLASEGVTVHTVPAAAVAGADTLVLMLSDAAAIQAVLRTLPEGALSGRCVIQMATILPAESRQLAEHLRRSGACYVEAPVLGSIPEAREGRLLVMAGADTEADFERASPVLAALGENPRHVGPVGQGAALKLAFNQLIASLTAAFSLSLGLVRREGAEVDTFMEILRESALYAPTFDKKLDKMLSGDFGTANFPVKHLLKDVRLAERAAEDAQLIGPWLPLLAQLLEQAQDRGLADADYSAIYSAIAPEPSAH